MPVRFLHIASATLATTIAWRSAAAEPARWRPVGPEGGPIRIHAVDPAAPGTIYATLPGPPTGVLSQSTDAGQTWRSLALPYINGVLSVAVGPGVVYLAAAYRDTETGVWGQGIFRSTDRATTWTRTGGVGTPRLVSPENPDVLFGINLNGAMVERSTDAGASWKAVPMGDVYALAFETGRPGRLCASNMDGGLYCADDPAGSWGLVGPLPRYSAGDTFVADPATPSTFLIGAPAGAARTTDGGRTWRTPSGDNTPGQIVAIEPRTATAFSITYERFPLARKGQESPFWLRLPLDSPGECATPTAPTILAAGDGRTLYAQTRAGGWVTRDLGDSWSLLSGLGRLQGVVALDPTGPASLLLSTEAGIFRSSDAGGSWKAAPADPNGRCLGFGHFASGGNLVYAIPPYVGRLSRSTDGGRTFTQTSGELFFYPTSMAVDPLDPADLWIATSGEQIYRTPETLVDGPYLEHSTDGGQTFVRVDVVADGAPRWIGRILFDPRDPGTLWAAGSGLYRHRGGSWRTLAAPPLEGDSLAYLAIDGRGGFLYAGTIHGRLFASGDDAATWSDITSSLPIEGTNQAQITALLADPASAGTLYLGLQGLGVFRTTDGGLHWQPFGEALPDPAVTDLLLDERGVPILYAKTPSGVFALDVAVSLRLERVAPRSGASAGGTLVVLSGEGFRPDSRVSVGGTKAASVSFLDPRTLRIRTPAHAAGPADVVVTNPDGSTASLPAAFHYEVWGSCPEDGETLCLEEGRFLVRAARAGGPAHAEPLTIKSGWFWFDWNADPKVTVKVLDGRSANGRYWVFVSTLTDEAVTVTVTDSVTGRSRDFRAAPGSPLAAIDRETFASD